MRVIQLPGKAHATNPYNTLLCESIEAQDASVSEYSLGATGDVVHVHWPEYPLSRPSALHARLALLKMFVGLRWAKARGAKIVWTAHNLRPHERFYPALEKRFYSAWNQLVDGVVCLSSASKEALIEQYPELNSKPIFVIRHGDYRPRISGQITSEAAREKLRIPKDSRVIGCLGAIRSYKNVPMLVRAFSAVAAPEDVLLIAGKPNTDELKHEILSESEGLSNVRIEFKFLSDEEMELFGAACDGFVFPYRDILNSGSALYALSLGKRVIAPHLGSLPELRADVGEDFVYLYEGEFCPEALRAGLNWLHQPVATSPNLSQYAWSEIGRLHVEAYQSLLSPKNS